MLPKNKIDDLIEKHSLLEKQLSSGDIDKKNLLKSLRSTLIQMKWLMKPKNIKNTTKKKLN